MDKEKQKKLQNYNPNILGGEEEEKVYNQLRKSLQENGIKNTVVINSWKDKLTQKSTAAEFDFLIVSEPFQTIFHVEVKRTCTKQNSAKAAEQLENGIKVINSNIQFPKNKQWKYAKLIYFGRDDKKQSFFCSECHKFLIGPCSDIWSEITKNSTQPPQTDSSKQTYQNILKFLLFEMFKQESCATNQQLIEETRKTTDAMSTTKNIFFWSKEQLNIIKATKDAKRVALTSEFGTGKTILLKEKAKELIQTETRNICEFKGNEAEKSQQEKNKIIFVIFEAANVDTNLKLECEKDFEHFRNYVKVIGVQGISGNSNFKISVFSVSHYFPYYNNILFILISSN